MTTASHSHQCPGCDRRFRTPQGLGLHFAWNRRKDAGCVRHEHGICCQQLDAVDKKKKGS